MAANAFADLPPEPLSGASDKSASAPGPSGNAFADLPPIDLKAESEKAYAGTTVPYAAASVGSGFNRGVARTLGAPVDAATWAMKKAGLYPSGDNAPVPFGSSEWIGKHVMPSPLPVHNELESGLQAAGSGAASALVPALGAAALGEGALAAAAPYVGEATNAGLATSAGVGAVSGVGGQLAADAVPDKYKPLAEVVGGIAAPGVALGVPALALQGGRAIRDALPPITQGQVEPFARRQVGREMNAAAANPTSAVSALGAAPREIIPGSEGTTGPMSGDTGLIAYEKSIAESPEGKAAYSERMAQQNAARQNAISSVQPNGVVTDLPEAVRANAAATDAKTQQAVADAQTRAATNEQLVNDVTQAHVEGAQQAHASALANLQSLKPDASPLDTATHFRAVRDALEQQGSESVSTAQNAASQARTSAAPLGQTPEAVGSALRVPFDAGSAAATDATLKLYAALPKDMVAPTSEIAAKAKSIQAGQLPEHSPISGEEARLYGLAQEYGPSMPLANVNALRGSILSARSTLRQSDPQAYGRLGQLHGVVEGAVDHAVENRAALDSIAVRRGNMAASDALPARISKVQDAENEWQQATQRPKALATSGDVAGQAAGRSESVVSGGNGVSSAGGVRSGNVEGIPGISQASGRASPSAPELTAAGDATSSPLRQANAAYREKKQTFDEGPIGEAFAKVGRGENAYSNAELAGKVFHGRPTAGEDMRAYLKAAGSDGVPAASDAAAYSFHQSAMKDGALDPSKAAKWISDHKGALSELPADVRGKFENAATAQQAVDDAMAKQRDNLAGFDKSEAGRIAGLGHDGDIVKHIGSIVDSKTAPEQRLSELANSAKSNPAAQDGLRRAVIEHVLDKFIPEGAAPKVDALQAYVNAKAPVLSKVLSPEEIKNISDHADSINAAKMGVEQAHAARAEAIKGVQQSGKEAVQNAAQARATAMGNYKKGEIGQLAGVYSEDSIINTVRGALNAQNAAERMGALAKEAAKVPGASDALKKAVLEVIKRDSTSTTEAGVSKVMQQKRAQLQTFMDTKTDALKSAGLSDHQIGVLRAVTEDGLQANRTISAVKSKGGSDTQANEAYAAKLAQGNKGSMIGHIAVDAGLAGVGHVIGGLPGAFIGKYIGDKVMGSMRESGINRVKQLRVEAILNPDLGVALMKEVPKQPNRDSAALLGLRLRQMSMAGILANQQH